MEKKKSIKKPPKLTRARDYHSSSSDCEDQGAKSIDNPERDLNIRFEDV